MVDRKLLELVDKNFDDRLYKCSDKEYEVYLTKLFQKIIDYASAGDIYNYNHNKKLLNESLLIMRDRVKNFHTFYNEIRLKIAGEYIKKQFDKDLEFNIFDTYVTNPDTISYYDLLNLKEYSIYCKALDNADEYYLFSNDKYNVVVKFDEVIIIDKKVNDYNESRISFDFFTGNINVLKNFITQQEQETPDVKISDVMSINNKMTIEKFMEENEDEFNSQYIVNQYENDKFNVVWYDVDLIIADKRSSDSVVGLFFVNTGENSYNKFVDFIHYCMND